MTARMNMSVRRGSIHELARVIFLSGFHNVRCAYIHATRTYNGVVHKVFKYTIRTDRLFCFEGGHSLLRRRIDSRNTYSDKETTEPLMEASSHVLQTHDEWMSAGCEPFRCFPATPYLSDIERDSGRRTEMATHSCQGHVYQGSIMCIG